MSAWVQVFSDQERVIKACGRACPDMGIETRPTIPTAEPPSLAAILRAHPEVELADDWLEGIETSPTIH